MLFIGIDIGRDYIKIAQASQNENKELIHEYTNFKNSPYIPFTFYYDFYQGGIIVHPNTTNLKEENLILSLSVFLEEEKSANEKTKHSSEKKNTQEVESCRIRMKDLDINISSDQILIDYFQYVKQNLLSCDKNQEIYAEITTNLRLTNNGLSKLLNSIKASGFDNVAATSPTLPSLLPVLQSSKFRFEEKDFYLIVDIGRKQSRFCIVQYINNDYKEIEMFVVNIGIFSILKDIVNLFTEQIFEINMDFTKEDECKISEIAEEALFFIVKYYGKAKSRVYNHKGIELFIDEKSFSEIIVRGFIKDFRTLLLKAMPKSPIPKFKGIIPVGGGLKIPEICKYLENLFNSQIIKLDKSELLLAQGLATFSLMNYSIFDLKEFQFFKPRDNVEAIPMDIGISTSNDLLDYNIMHVLIDREFPLPMKNEVNFAYRVKCSNSIKIYLLEGNEIVANQNSLFRKFTIQPKNEPEVAFREVKIKLKIEKRFVVWIQIQVGSELIEQKFRKTRYSSNKGLTESIETDFKRQTFRAKLAILIKKIQAKYHSIKNTMMKKKMEHIFARACDFEIFAKQRNFDIDILKSKLDELESLK